MSIFGDRAAREKSKKIIYEIIIKISYILILYVFLISRPLGRFKLRLVEFCIRAVIFTGETIMTHPPSPGVKIAALEVQKIMGHQTSRLMTQKLILIYYRPFGP